MKNAIYNPHDRPASDLPTIYAYNEGGPPRWLVGVLIAEDGTEFGEHISTDESHMPHDLGVIEGSRPDRHEDFRQHYPDGYRMEFVGYAEAESHLGLRAALRRNEMQDRQGADTAA